MRNRSKVRAGLLVLLAGLAVPSLALAAGFDDFKLTKAIPSDAMMAVHVRNHEGLNWLNDQWKRVFAEFEKQNFGRDIRRLMLSAVKQSGGDPNSFDATWQQVNDLAAAVDWFGLGKREFAFAMKIAPPLGSEFVYLLLPAPETVDSNFDALAGLAKGLAALGGESVVFTREGQGSSQICKITFPMGPAGLGVTLAREKDVILIGWGAGLAEQSLALLQGASDASATLAATERFRTAFKTLPPPNDSAVFVDIARIMTQVRVFADMAAKTPGSQPATDTQPAEMPFAWVSALVDEIDLWEYAAVVSSTQEKKTEQEGVVVLRADAMKKTLGKTLYGNGPVKDPLKFVPKIATTVDVNSGLNLKALYDGALAFIRDDVPNGKALIEEWDAHKKDLPIDIEQDVLSWLGGEVVSYGAPIPTPFNPGSTWILPTRDPEKATALLEKLSTMINSALAEQNAGVEDANLPAAPGFKRVILPPMFMMIPGIGRPIYGIKDGALWIGNGPEIVTAGLRVAGGEDENFTKNERFASEGLPVPAAVTAYSFHDLTTMGEELGNAFAMVGMITAFQPQLAKDPFVGGLISMVSKLGNVVKKIDFYKSSCTVKTMEGNVEHSKSVTHYQDPPKPKTTTQPAGGGGASPAAEKKPEPAGEKKPGH